MFNTKAEQLSNSITSSQINSSLSNQANREGYARTTREYNRSIIAQTEATYRKIN